MDYKNYIHIPKSTLLTNNLNLDTKNSSKQSLLSTPVNSATSSLDHITSNKTYSENRSIIQPTVKYEKINIYLFFLIEIYFLVNY